MTNKPPITEEEKSKYRKGCLTGLCCALAIIVLSAGIGQVTSYRTNIDKSVEFLHSYRTSYPTEAKDYDIITHVANNNFITVKTNLPNTGEGISKALTIKENSITILKKENKRAPGIKVLGKSGKTLFDSTTRSGD